MAELYSRADNHVPTHIPGHDVDLPPAHYLDDTIILSEGMPRGNLTYHTERVLTHIPGPDNPSTLATIGNFVQRLRYHGHNGTPARSAALGTARTEDLDTPERGAA